MTTFFLDGREAGQGRRLYRRVNDMCVFFLNRAPLYAYLGNLGCPLFDVCPFAIVEGCADPPA